MSVQTHWFIVGVVCPLRPHTFISVLKIINMLLLCVGLVEEYVTLLVGELSMSWKRRLRLILADNP